MEYIEHLFIDCCKVQAVWNLVNHTLGCHIYFPDPVSSRLWITDYGFSTYTLSIIAAMIWFLWKSRCEAIFQNITPNFTNLGCKAIAHVNDFKHDNASLTGQRLIINNFLSSDGHLMFFASNWTLSNKVGHLGFFLTTPTYSISCAGSCRFVAESALESELKALGIALRSSLDRHLDLRYILHCNQELPRLLLANNNPTSWRFNHIINDVNHLLIALGNPSLIEIPGRWIAPAFALSTTGSNLHTLNLFLTGRDLPRWIMKIFVDFGFSF